MRDESRPKLRKRLRGSERTGDKTKSTRMSESNDISGLPLLYARIPVLPALQVK